MSGNTKSMSADQSYIKLLEGMRDDKDAYKKIFAYLSKFKCGDWMKKQLVFAVGRSSASRDLREMGKRAYEAIWKE